MRTLVIGNKNYSSWSLRPWLLLRHFEVVFEERRLLLDTPAFHDQIGRLSPNRRVPVLHDDGLVVWDSLAICEYANERYLDGRGWPADPRARAQARSAAAEMHSGFAALRQQLPMNCRRQPDAYRWDADADRDIARIQDLWRDLRASHGAGGPFLCGAFGIVDAMFAPVVMRFIGYGVELDDQAHAYADAIRALPAFAEWLAAAHAESEHLPATDNLK
ncbi:glutathione S-transferase [Luteimonas cucumeris]|uniref:Glutathione S-transferase n=1 Tax=Luteimonas cucumeris TaxID=985012 RepID=A0A562L5A9_9GAMM|nr:glutathione S-transferase family protein [Luteimonas cucumeris]TWI02696.1 glutathione S-transferase [Luteimonas cucumeris]